MPGTSLGMDYINRLRDVLYWLICLEPLYVAIKGLKNDDPYHLDEINLVKLCWRVLIQLTTSVLHTQMTF